MKEYRIVKKYYRRDDTAEVKYFFQVQYLGYTFSLLFFPRKLKWKACRREKCGYMEVYWADANFDNDDEALRYLNHLIEPVHVDEVMPLFKYGTEIKKEKAEESAQSTGAKV